MTLLDGSDSARQPIFLQYLNPEVSRLYKFAPSLGDDNYWKSLHLTKLALFVGDHVSMPASYLIEVPFIDRLLEDLRPASEQGMVRYMSSSADLTAYAPKKSREYRDDPEFRTLYSETDLDHLQSKLQWSPRTGSSSADLAGRWYDEIEGGYLGPIFESLDMTMRPTVSQFVGSLERVPERLAGRAFITRFVEPLLPFELSPGHLVRVELLLSQEYLLSYLRECRGVVIAPTPWGELDCQLPHVDRDGSPLTVAYEYLSRWLYATALDPVLRMSVQNLLRVWADPIVEEFLSLLLGDLRSNHAPLRVSLSQALNRLKRPAASDGLAPVLDRLGSALQSVDYGHREVPTRGLTEERIMAVPARDRRRVFLVHGQDAERAAHLRKLVIYAGALVVEWEEAVEWTGKGTPTTLEVIVGALDRVQAVLVLFSPDENVSLRAELGGGQEGFQPRPNVYVEAGMALAVAPERTVIVEFGTSRAASDLAGLNTIRYSDSVEKRVAVIGRLGSAGVEVPSKAYLSETLPTPKFP